MAWPDRVREAAYTSPSGERLRFDFRNVRERVKSRANPFEFTGVDGAYVQPNGRGPRRFPMSCYFSGEDHDLAATAFVAALLEPGIGRLEHPFYGTFDVVPTGEIGRRDDLADGGNQTVIEVTFWNTLRVVYPRGQTDLQSDAEAALTALDEAAGEQFAASLDTDTVASRANVADAVRNLMTDVGAELSVMTRSVNDVRVAFDEARDIVDLGLDVLLGTPAQLAGSISSLVKLPARAGVDIALRLEGYANLGEAILTGLVPAEVFESGTVLPRRLRTVANDFHTSVVFAAASVAGSIDASINHQFGSRPEAISAADAILTQFDAVVAWMDSGYETLGDLGANGGTDTGETYQALDAAAALAAGYMVEISFSLLPERSITLDRNRTIIDLCAELYRSVDDDRLNFLIDTNNLSGDEILELPRGRTIVFYA